ncbi:splicing factor, arginine/serine-rich 19 [Notechis scutatus]|uniref:Splicing factor, arginine/serine-rich 19 n=1 Tax=Notechis scutatus TaxID=8663 RepID=A0A6J1U567_9SAUR|nr:splicing factor, arginine/serine-rich 19 [Notechis scutatus]XP_026525421.1 splicing factor, arginine/serine-rich 19 [Notechis scutatus]XP_026525422.1 splicing factor, arginine/serine-rich 19 [Notechis scutatus]
MEEENQHSPVREGSAHSGEKPASEPSLDSDWDQSGTLCIGHIIILKALQQAVGSGLAGELKDPASEKDADCKCTSQSKWCWNSRTEGFGGSWLGTGDFALAYDRNDPMGEVFQAPSSGIMPALAGILNYLDWPYHMPREVESSTDAQAVYGDEDIEEVELVAEVRLGDIGALSGISRRNLSWRRQKAACLGSSPPCWRGSRASHIGRPSVSEQPHVLDPHRILPVHRTDRATWTSDLERSKVLQSPKADRTSSPCLAMTLGIGMGVSTGGQQRPQSTAGRESESQQRSQPPPGSSLDKADSSTSSSSSCSSSSSSSMSCHQGLPGEDGGSSNPCPPIHSPDLDIYDPFHPTDEDNLNGDFGFGDSPRKEAEGGRHDQKYDPFDPTGSNPSSSISTPSPEEEEEEDEEEEDEDDDHDEQPPDMSHSISRISETLAGIYDENSLSQDFPSSEKGQEDSEPEAEPSRGYETEATCPAESSESKGLSGADSTLPEELPSDQGDSKTPEPCRRVFVVDLAPKGRLDAEAKTPLEGKVSLEVVTVGNAKLRGGEKTSKGVGHPRAGRRSSVEWDGSGGGESEIEEGEIVQPEDERYSPIRLFRSRCRPAEPRTLRVVEGDDFLSLHADSDEEGALQIDFNENQPDPRWKGVDLRRKILTQRRERYQAPSPLPPPPPPPAPKRPASKAHSGSSSGSCKKSKREHKRSRECKTSKTKETYGSSWNPKKKSKSRSKSKERRHSHHRTSRSRSHHRTSRSWSPSISTSLSAVGSSHTSAERHKSRRSKSKEKRHGHCSRSRSSSRAHRSRHKDKHRGEGGRKKKKRSQSRSREKHLSHRLSKDKEREVHLLEEPKPEKALMERRRDARTVVPPSIQDLNDNDLFTIKRTITVNQQEKMEGLLETPESAKREVLYDSEGMSFDACFSDREPAEEPKSNAMRLNPKEDAIPSRKDKRPEEDTKQKMCKEKERKRAYLEDRPGTREKYKKKLKEGPPTSEQQELPKIEKKGRTDRDKTGKKIKAGGHKESSKLGSGRKVKLQSKVAVLIREGVSSTTSVKEMGSIGVKFSRDKESRSPFLKSEEKVLMVGAPAAGQGEMTDVKEQGFKPKKIKGLKTKMGVKKLKGIKPKGASEPKKKKKLKVKTGLKKSKADSCSQGAISPLRVKEEPSWSGSEKSGGTAKPPSPQPLAPGQELTPDSQTVDSSCKTPDVSFLPEDPPVEQPRVPADEPEADSLSEPKEEQPLQQPSHPPRSLPQPPAPMSWNLQGGVDCTSGVLALTALLFKMEEANLASRAKAQELIQATNQILTHTKPSASLAPPQPPAPPTHLPSSHLAVPPISYHLQGSMPLGGCGSTPSTPTGGLPGTLSQASAGPPSAGIFASSSGTDLGSTSSEGRGDSDKYLKKLHTQERAVEEVKLAIKPYYQKKEITKEEYKDILRKAVHKICHSKSGEINPVKVNNLVKAYVQRYKYFRKHGRKMDEEQRPPKETGGADKSGLPMPPL